MSHQDHRGNPNYFARQETLEAENMVLGSVFLEPDLIHEINLEPIHFSIAKNKLLFQTMRELAAEGIRIDPVTMTKKLGNNIENVGGVSYISQLAASVPSTANLEAYQRIVLDDHKKRVLVAAAAAYLNDPTEEKAEDLYTHYIEMQEVGKVKEKTKKDILYELYEEMNEDFGDLRGIDTGFKDLNDMTGGLQGGDLIIVAGRPSMGKTAFALNLASQCCVREGVADVFSLEMPEKQLTQRFLSAIGWIDGSKWRNSFRFFSDRDRASATKAIGVYSQWVMNIHDEAKQTVADIRREVRKTSRENPGKQHIVVIDYLQLITPLGKFDRHDLAVGSITRELKQMARQFNVPVILLSQLNRGVEQRQDKRPMLSDLRDSGSIEQDADVVMLLYREEYYDRQSEGKNIVEINIAKQRNGPVGTVQLAFLKEFSRFRSLERKRDLEGA